jgi:predicted permease
VLGRTLLVEGRPHAIVGVMPAAFSYGLAATVGWIPFDEAAERLKAKSTFGTIMRLRPGLSLEQGERLVDAAADRMQRERPGASPWTVDLGLLDSRRGDPSTRRALGVFAAAVALILLIACANVANLLLGRTLSRQREIGVRTALGASRSQLVRLLLTEAFVLVCIGMVLSIGFAWWAARVLPALVPEALGLFARNPMSIDLRVLAGAALLMIAIPVLCSIAPAYRATRRDVIGALEGSARVVTGGRSSRRLWQALQAVQILLTFVLLIGAGLLGSSFVRMLRADAGYDVDRLVAVTLDVPSSRYTDRAAREGFYRAVLDRVRSLPGVEAAAYGSHPAGGGSGRLTIAGREQEDLRLPPLSLYGVDANYFATMGIPIKHGRGFTAADMESAADGAIVVDERLAAMFWPGESPLGKQLRFGLVPVWSTVVGVAASVKTRHFAARGGTIQAYYPLPSSNALVLRTQRPDDVIALLRPAVKGIDPVVDIYRASSAADLYGDVLTTPRFSLVVMLAFGLLALVTAAVGLSAVISQAVARRTPEIGLRIALGAQLGQIRALVMREAVAPMTAGIGGGLLVAFWVTQYLDAMLYQVAPHDPATYAAVLTFLAVVAGAAALIPARRAARLDPVQTLREK